MHVLVFSGAQGLTGSLWMGYCLILSHGGRGRGQRGGRVEENEHKQD